MERKIKIDCDKPTMNLGIGLLENFKLQLEATAEEDTEEIQETFEGTFTIACDLSLPPPLSVLSESSHIHGYGSVHFTTSIDTFDYEEDPPDLVLPEDVNADCWAAAFATVRTWAGHKKSLDDIFELAPGSRGCTITQEEFEKVAASITLLMKTMGHVSLNDPRELKRLIEAHGPLVVVTATPISRRSGLAHCQVVYGVEKNEKTGKAWVKVADPAFETMGKGKGYRKLSYTKFISLYEGLRTKNNIPVYSGSRIAYFPQRAGRKRPPPYPVISAEGTGTMSLEYERTMYNKTLHDLSIAMQEMNKLLGNLEGKQPEPAEIPPESTITTGKEELLITVKLCGGTRSDPTQKANILLQGKSEILGLPLSLKGIATLS